VEPLARDRLEEELLSRVNTELCSVVLVQF